MKKFIALSLSLLMLLSVCLTGCAEKTDEEAVEDISKKASKSAMTLSLYLLSEKDVEKCDDCVAHDAGEAGVKVCTDQTDAQPCTYRLVSNAINRITESKYKTRLILNYCADEEEYYAKLEQAFADREAAKKAGALGNTTIAEETEEDETFVNELGQVEIKYPTIAGYQVDLFFLGGTEKFNQYKDMGVLATLDTELADASKKLNQYIFPEFLSGIKTLGGGTTYAIPNNRTVGQYTYLLLNKEALNVTYRRTEGGNTTYDGAYVSLVAQDCKEFLNDVYSYQNDKFYPIYKAQGITTADIANANMRFIGVDENGNLTNSFSILGASYLKGDTYGSVLNIGAAMDAHAFTYRDTLATLKEYESKGYFTAEQGKTFAAGYIKGNAQDVEQYRDDYEVVVIENPTLTGDDILESTFAVGANTISLTRSMQILTLLNTDEEFRNLILYGIEGEHYRLIDSDVENAIGDTYKQAERLNKKYLMDPEKTGNVFVSYPTIDQLPSINDWGIKQNQDLRVDMLLGLDLSLNGYDLTEELQIIQEYSNKIWEKYLNKNISFETFEKWEDHYWTDKEQAAWKALTATHKEDEVCDSFECKSIWCAYIAWATSAGIMK